MKIPRIIHQLYENPNGSSNVPENLKSLSETWISNHPDWEYRFWDKKAMNDFLESFFPELVSRYHSFPFNVQRWDAIRYLILYRIGGMYVDMDYECMEPFDELLGGNTCCLGLEPARHSSSFKKPYIVGNALMACIPEHNFFKSIINHVFSDVQDELHLLSPKIACIEYYRATYDYKIV